MKLLSRMCVLLLCCSFIATIILAEDLNDDHQGESDIPRVRIKVFRGPNQEENGQTYASWGFWVKQPSGK